MERRTAVRLVGRYVAISVGALVLGGGIIAAGLVLAPGGHWGVWNALKATNPSGVYAAAGLTGILLFVLGVLVIAAGRIVALQQFLALTVREALDEEVARIERDLAREVRGIRRTAEGEDVAGRLDSLDREVDRLRAAVGGTHAGPDTNATPGTAEPAATGHESGFDATAGTESTTGEADDAVPERWTDDEGQPASADPGGQHADTDDGDSDEVSDDESAHGTDKGTAVESDERP